MKRGIILVAWMIISSVISMGEDRLDKYERGFERRYPLVYVRGREHDLEYDLKDMDTFILIEVEIEDDFFGERLERLDDEGFKELDTILKMAARDLREVFHKPVRARAEYEGRNVFMKRY